MCGGGGGCIAAERKAKSPAPCHTLGKVGDIDFDS